VLPFATVRKLNALCREKHPGTELTELKSFPYVGDRNKVWWRAKWAKRWDDEGGAI
jgi:hypothetical protein